MKVDTMRNIDRWVGVPLCAGLSLLFALGKLFAAPRLATPIKKALFIELSEMGSAVLVDPAMRKLQREAQADLHFVIFKKNAPSLDLLGTIPKDKIFCIDDDNLVSLTLSSLRFLAWCRQRRIDTVFDLELFSRFTALLTALSGAYNRIGFHAYHDEGLYRGNFLTHKVAYNPHMHIAKNFISLIHAAVSDHDEHPYSKTLIAQKDIELAKAECSEKDQNKIREKVASLFPDTDLSATRIVLINPNASDLLPQRRWPQSYFVQVIKQLLKKYNDIVVVITGAPSERAEAGKIVNAVGDERCANSAGLFAFQDLGALYTISRCMLTNDSGPGHFSAVTPLRTFVLFGPETPKLYGSLGNSVPIYAGLACSPCVSATNHRKTTCTDNQCLKVITPDEVFAFLKDDLDKG